MEKKWGQVLNYQFVVEERKGFAGCDGSRNFVNSQTP